MISLSHRVTTPFLALLLSTLTLLACGGGYSATNPGSGGGPQGNLQALSVYPTTIPSIPVAGIVRLTAYGYYAVGTSNQDLTGSASWSSSNAGVATVERGIVTGTGAGSATISATAGGKTVPTTVVVGLTPTISLTPMSQSTFSLSTKTQQFQSMATYSDGTVLDLTVFATWTSNPGGIAEFNYNDPYGFDPGLATFLATGTTEIAATLNTGEAATMMISVVP